MNPIAVTMIVLYLVGTTLVGALLARRNRGAADWSVAGGGMGILMIAVGIAGTRVGGAATYGVAGDVIRDGLWNLWYGVNSFLAMALTGLFFSIPYRRLKIHTVGEIFSVRFPQKRLQIMTSLCVQTEYFIVNLIEVFVTAKILTGIFPDHLSFEWAVWISAFVIISYTALGGLWGSSATNLIHCLTILFGLLAVALAGMHHIGGWEAVQTKVNAALTERGADPSSWWSFTGAGWGAIFGMFFSATIHTPAASIYCNYSTAAKNEKSILPAFLMGGLIAAPMTWLAGWIGVLTLAHYGAGAQFASYHSITRLALEINPWLGGIAMAAVLAAVISSGGPILLASATMFVRDWLPFSKTLSPARQLFAYRLTTVIYGMMAALIVYIVKQISVLDLLLLGFAAVVPPAIAVGYLIYYKRTTEAGAFWGIVAGYVGGIIWFALIEWAKKSGFELNESSGAMARLFHYCFVHTGDGIDPSYATTLIPLVAIPVISLATRETSERKESFYATLSGKSNS